MTADEQLAGIYQQQQSVLHKFARAKCVNRIPGPRINAPLVCDRSGFDTQSDHTKDIDDARCPFPAQHSAL